MVPDTTPPDPAAKKRRSPFAFLFKSALGCTFFALGALVALVLLAPTLLSPVVRSSAPEVFSDLHRGSLEVAGVDLAWFSEQRLEGVVLRDPEGGEVARLVSATLPSLWSLLRSDGARIGRVTAAFEADLVQDDAGVTNLERALEAKAPRASAPDEPDDGTGPSLADRLAALELELALEGRRVTWSDVGTRALGRPFEVRDLVVDVRARPGQPIVAKAGAKLVSDTPGTLAFDARVAGPIDPDAAWPFGEVGAQGEITGFSSAMVDGLAGLRGDLVESLGPRFDVRFDARGVTPQGGTLALTFRSERASASFAGRFEGGVLRGEGAEPLLATLALPRAVIERRLAPSLPAGTSLAFAGADEPWSVRVGALALPVPEPWPAQLDLASLAPSLEAASLELAVELPGRIAFANETTRAAGLDASLGDVRLSARAAPGEPLTARLDAALDTGAEGRLSADLAARDPWRALAAGELPRVDLDLELSGLATAAIDALAGRPGLLAEGIGRELRVDVVAKDASPEQGTLHVSAKAERLSLDLRAAFAGGVARAEGEGLVLRLEPASGWLEAQAAPHLPEGFELGVLAGPIELRAPAFGVPLPAGGAGTPAGNPQGRPAEKKGLAKDGAGAAGDPLAALRGRTSLDLEASLPGFRVANASTRAARIEPSLSALRLGLSLAESGQLALELRGALDTGRAGTFALQAKAADAWAFASAQGGELPPLDLSLALDGVAVAALDALAGQQGRLVAALGDTLAVGFSAREASASGGTIDLEATTPTTSVRFAGALADGVLRSRAPEELAVRVVPSEELLAREIGSALPAGGRVTLPSAEPIVLEVRGLAVPLPVGPGAGAKGAAGATSAAGADAALDVAALLDGVAAKVSLRVASVGYADDALRAAGTSLSLANLALDAVVEPGKPLGFELGAALDAGLERRGTLRARASVPGWTALARGGALPPVDAQVDLAGLPTEALDLLAGESGLVSGLLGPTLDLALAANARAADEASFTLSLKSPTTSVAARGAIAGGVLALEGDGLEASVRAPRAWVEGQVSPRLPPGAKLSIADDAAPLVLRVRDARIPLPKPAEAQAAAAEATPQAQPGAAGEQAELDAAPGGGALASLLERAGEVALTLEAELPTLSYADEATGGAPVAIAGFSSSVRIAPKERPRVRAKGRIGEDGGGGFELDLEALDPLAKLAEPGGVDAFRARIAVKGERLPVALVDALAGQDGLLVDALGARADLEVASESLSLSAGAYTASFRSDQQHTLRAEGTLEERTLKVVHRDGIVASVNLGPLVSRRVVGNLVPMMVDVQKPGQEPILLAVDALSAPLDGDLSKLDALVRLELGTVSFDFLPGLEGLFGNLAERTAAVPSLAIPIEKGVARYDALPLTIAGRPYVFSGSFSLVDKQMSLATKVPLAALGKKVSDDLDKARGFLSPDLEVPIEIRGTWNRPRISVGKDFLKKVVEDAAGKGLEGLLKDAFGGKKK